MPATHHRQGLDGKIAARWAWWSLLGFVPSFGLAFAVGEGLISALGYPTGGSAEAPWWAALTASIPALVVFVLPAVAAVHFGRRAMSLGDARGRLPTILGIVVASLFVLTNGLSAVISWVS